MLPFTEMAFYFMIYAFLGWCAEVAFAAMKSGKFINRGFLNGPYCPIYGFGVLLIILCLTPLQHNLPLLFLGSCAITTLLEYLTGAALEKLFHTRWWDYSQMPFNIHGHVCLLFSVLWGLACTFIMRLIHPLIAAMYVSLPTPAVIAIISVLGTVMLLDTVATIIAVRSMTRQLQHISDLAAELRQLSDELGENISEHAMDAKAWWDTRIQPKLEALDARADQYRDDMSDALEDLRGKIDNISEAVDTRRASYREKLDLLEDKWDEKQAAYLDRLQQLSKEFRRSAIERRMMDAYPDLKDLRNQQSLERLRSYHERLLHKK